MVIKIAKMAQGKKEKLVILLKMLQLTLGKSEKSVI
jgi:hypothetical protein